jgi:hypothetical protein
MQNGSAERFTAPEGGEEVACEAYHSGCELNQVLISSEGEGGLRGLVIGIDETRK